MVHENAPSARDRLMQEPVALSRFSAMVHDANDSGRGRSARQSHVVRLRKFL
jgi:hypothetical protein